MKLLVMKSIMEDNQKKADENRRSFLVKGITAVNVMGSPGSGKTSVIIAVSDIMKESVPISVIEGDIASAIDAEKAEASGLPAVQINTAGACHLDAEAVGAAASELVLASGSVLFIENVGNLVCPTAFDLGEKVRMVVSSIPEGHDKPFKYISMFEAADAVVLNKTDLKPYVDFDSRAFVKGIRSLNDTVPIFEVSCRTGEGIRELADWLDGTRGH